MSYPDPRARVNPGTNRTPGTPTSIPNGAAMHHAEVASRVSQSASPIISRSSSGSFGNSSLATSSSDSPQNSPSPGQNSLLNTSTQEMFQVDSFTNDGYVNENNAFTKTCSMHTPPTPFFLSIFLFFSINFHSILILTLIIFFHSICNPFINLLSTSPFSLYSHLFLR